MTPTAEVLGQDSRSAGGIIGLVREESHLDEMRAAIRGDFERLERRRGGQGLLRTARPRPRTGREDAEEAEDSSQPRPWLSRFLGR